LNCADFRATLQQVIDALSESINAQLASSLAKIHENTVHIDDRMRSQFEKVNKTAATNYERPDNRPFIVERDTKTWIQVHDELRTDIDACQKTTDVWDQRLCYDGVIVTCYNQVT
jgi:hypothetical protein